MLLNISTGGKGGLGGVVSVHIKGKLWFRFELPISLQNPFRSLKKSMMGEENTAGLA